jgi:hypothetical protein
MQQASGVLMGEAAEDQKAKHGSAGERGCLPIVVLLCSRPETLCLLSARTQIVGQHDRIRSFSLSQQTDSVVTLRRDDVAHRSDTKRCLASD